MSFLRDFGAGLFTGIGNQMQQREEEERRMQIEEALAKRRLAWQTQTENKINPRRPEAVGVPVQRGPDNWAQPTEQYVPPEFDPETFDITKPASYVPGPDLPASDPRALSPKDAALRDYRERQLTQQKELGEARTAALGRRSADARTSEPKIREFGDRPWQLNEETGQWEPMAGPPPKSDSPERAPHKAPTLNPKDREDFLKRAEKGTADDLWRIAETLDLQLPGEVAARRGSEVKDMGWFAADDASGLDQLRGAVRDGIRKYGREAAPAAGKAADAKVEQDASGVYQPKTEAEYDAIPSGATYYNPTTKTRKIKP